MTTGTGSTNPCWLFTGSKAALGGYGRVWLAGKPVYVHRLFYELAYGPIPPGLQIDHRCHNPACFKPSHLRAVTATENIRTRSLRRLGTHCRRDHALTGENVGLNVRGQRFCRACKKGRGLAAYLSRK